MPTEIDHKALQPLLEQGAQLVDVLVPREYADDHLPGAINIPLQRVHQEAAAQLDQQRPVIVYCHDYQ